MALKKEILVASIGAPATIHRVDSVMLNKVAKSTIVVLSSFYGTSALAQLLNPLAQVSIELDGMPAKGQDAFEFAEAQLVMAAPDGVNTEPVIQQYTVDRYAFAGAEVLDL